MAAGVLLLGAAFAATDRQLCTVALPAGRAITVDLTIGHLRVHGEQRAGGVIEIVRTAPRDAALGQWRWSSLRPMCESPPE